MGIFVGLVWVKRSALAWPQWGYWAPRARLRRTIATRRALAPSPWPSTGGRTKVAGTRGQVESGLGRAGDAAVAGASEAYMGGSSDEADSPSVLSVRLSDGAPGVAQDAHIAIAFNQPMAMTNAQLGRRGAVD